MNEAPHPSTVTATANAADRAATPAAIAPTIPGLHLRFSLDEATAASLKAGGNQLFASPRRATTRNLRQVFWDTEGKRLGRAGIALGSQTMGQRRLQIIRDIRSAPAAGRVAVLQETPLNTDTLDVTRVAFFPGVTSELVGELSSAILLPIFGIDLARTQWRCAAGQTELTVSLESAVIEASSGRETHHQLEIALLNGPADGVYQLARQLVGAISLRLAERDLIQHGYCLVSGKDWWKAVVEEPALSDQQTVRSGFLAMARAGSASLRLEIARLSHEFAPERVHQARVALRRLRSLLSVFRFILPPLSRQRFSRALNDIASALGEVREWDVLIESTVLPLKTASGPDAALEYAVDQAVKRRETIVKKLKTTLLGKDFLLLCLDLGCWFDIGLWPESPTPAEQASLDENLVAFAETVLKQRHRKLISAAIKNPTVGELHLLRIQAKKLRYTADFLRSLFPAKAAKAYITRLKDIQEILGAVNDAAMAQMLMPQLVDANQPQGARAIGLVAGWTAANAMHARDRFDTVWQEFHAIKKFWR